MAEINHPGYYQFPRPAYEIADITVSMPHAVGSAMEYLYRAGKKPGNDAMEDLRKARWWIERYLQECICQSPDDEIF